MEISLFFEGCRNHSAFYLGSQVSVSTTAAHDGSKDVDLQLRDMHSSQNDWPVLNDQRGNRKVEWAPFLPFRPAPLGARIFALFAFDFVASGGISAALHIGGMAAFELPLKRGKHSGSRANASDAISEFRSKALLKMDRNL